MIPSGDVRRAMVYVLSCLVCPRSQFPTHLLTQPPRSALGIPPTKAELREFLEILDPDDEGHASYEPFVAICALKLHAKEDDEDGDSESEAHRREVDEAFALFTSGGSSGEQTQTQTQTLTLAHLKRVAMTLKQDDVDETLLRDMILEANGGAGVGRGVSRAEFGEVMRRAGAWR